MPIGKRLKEARLAKKMTQEDLAEAVGVSKGAIGNYESEVSSPKEPILIKLMKVLGVDANYLYQDFMFMFPNESFSLHLFCGDSAEDRLLEAYRAADERAQEDALKMLLDHPKKDTASTAG